MPDAASMAPRCCACFAPLDARSAAYDVAHMM